MNQSSYPLPVRSTCAYCGVGCGVQVTPKADGSYAIAGDSLHPANQGRLCVKGSALGETLGLEGRLLYPQLRTADGLQRVSWEAALDTVADGWRAIIDTHGPDAVALYVSGQLLTEDYYVANKLMKGYIGSANIDTNSRLCMSSAVAGYKRAFGEDLVPLCYDDLELADMVVLVGSNTAWCHPILFQRILKAKQSRPEMMIVVVDPRRTATCELADLHLPLKPGTDVWLFNGLLSYLARIGAVDPVFVEQHTSGLDDALEAANIDCDDPAAVAKICHIELPLLMTFYAAFAATSKTISAFSMGVNQSTSGTDKVNAIINCHLIGGRIGQPGMGPFSITGQPNAMGGREVGGMANMLAAHMDLDRAEHRDVVQTFWDSPAIASKPGLKAVDLFQAIEAGTVKAVWVIATNPLVSLPDADQARRALEKCELVVVTDIMQNTDTSACAHVLLPALGWGEKDGTVTNSERRISRQRAFLPAPGEALPDWKILSLFAQRMGFVGFDYDDAHAVFDEHARLSGFRNAVGDVPRAFDMSGLSGLSPSQYEQLEPTHWPARCTASGALEVEARLFKDHVFAHADGKARFIATATRAPAYAISEAFPLRLNTGRVRDQWHTMTRTGKSATLADHVPESFIDIHPQDALLHGVREGELARVSSEWGTMVARVQHGGGIVRGSVFIPIHWSGQTSSDARVGALVNPAVDPISGEPEFKHTPVRIEQFRVKWHGFILSRTEVPLASMAHWTRIQGRECIRYEVAGRHSIEEFGVWARALLGLSSELDLDADWLDYTDRSAGAYRAVHVVKDRIEQCIFISPRQDLPSRTWLAGLFIKPQLSERDRVGLLAGTPAEQGADTGPTVCSCFGVGRNTICAAIREHALKTVQQVTTCLKAGGNCGSCVPEIKKILDLTLPDLPYAEAEQGRLQT